MSPFFFTKLSFTSFFVFGFLSIIIAMVGDRYPRHHPARNIFFVVFVVFFMVTSMAIPFGIICGIWGW